MSNNAIIAQVVIFVLAIGVLLVGVLSMPPEIIPPEPTLSQIGITPERVIPTSILPESKTRTPEPTRIVLVRVESVNVHTLPELHTPVIGWVFSGQAVPVLVCSSGWALIDTPELFGWVNGTCLDPNPCGKAGTCQ